VGSNPTPATTTGRSNEGLNSSDAPGVIVFPPLIPLSILVVGTILSFIVLHYGIILREERYLESKFGDEYRSYKTKVPRYWWRF
jgi:protein-S-isoprenylcysteine O-methyltransferase Ste14